MRNTTLAQLPNALHQNEKHLSVITVNPASHCVTLLRNCRRAELNFQTGLRRLRKALVTNANPFSAAEEGKSFFSLRFSVVTQDKIFFALGFSAAEEGKNIFQLRLSATAQGKNFFALGFSVATQEWCVI